MLKQAAFSGDDELEAVVEPLLPEAERKARIPGGRGVRTGWCSQRGGAGAIAMLMPSIGFGAAVCLSSSDMAGGS